MLINNESDVLTWYLLIYDGMIVTVKVQLETTARLRCATRYSHLRYWQLVQFIQHILRGKYNHLGIRRSQRLYMRQTKMIGMLMRHNDANNIVQTSWWPLHEFARINN